MLAADLIAQPDGVNFSWPDDGSGRPELPAHADSGGKLPAGGNEAFIDGSAQGYKAQGVMILSTHGAPLTRFTFTSPTSACWRRSRAFY